MGGAVINQNQEIHKRSKRNVIRYYEQIQGKRDLLKMWEARNNPDDAEYIKDLKARIRKATVLLTHIKP
jgi:hypothetical protein